MKALRFVGPTDPERVIEILGGKPCRFGGHPNRLMFRTRVDGKPSQRGGFLTCPCGVSFNARHYRTMAHSLKEINHA